MSVRKLCELADLGDRPRRAFAIEGRRILLVRSGGALHAVAADCPHFGADLEDDSYCEDGVLTCTKHFWQWDVRTGEPRENAERPLPTYEVRVEGTSVWMLLEDRLKNLENVE